MPKQPHAKVAIAHKIGDRVKIKNFGGKIGRIVENRGPLGPGGAPIFRVLVQVKPTASYIELRGDQLLAAPAAAKVKVAKRAAVAIQPAIVATKAPKVTLKTDEAAQPIGKAQRVMKSKTPASK